MVEFLQCLMLNNNNNDNNSKYCDGAHVLSKTFSIFTGTLQPWGVRFTMSPVDAVSSNVLFLLLL